MLNISPGGQLQGSWELQECAVYFSQEVRGLYWTPHLLVFYLVLILHCPLAKRFINKGKMWGVVCFACSPTTQSALAGCSHPFSIISLLLWWIRKMLAVNLMMSETCSRLNEWGFTHITLHNVEVQTLVSHTESSVVCSTLWNSCWEILCHCHANQMEDFLLNEKK